MGSWSPDIASTEFLSACVLLASGTLGTVLVVVWPAMRSERVAKNMSALITVAGIVAFVCGLVGMVQRHHAGRWLPLLTAGLAADFLAAAMPRLARRAAAKMQGEKAPGRQ